MKISLPDLVDESGWKCSSERFLGKLDRDPRGLYINAGEGRKYSSQEIKVEDELTLEKGKNRFYGVVDDDWNLRLRYDGES